MLKLCVFSVAIIYYILHLVNERFAIQSRERKRVSEVAGKSSIGMKNTTDPAFSKANEYTLLICYSYFFFDLSLSKLMQG